MKLIRTKIKDLVLVKTNIYKDKRGFFKEVEKKNLLKKKYRNADIKIIYEIPK